MDVLFSDVTMTRSFLNMSKRVAASVYPAFSASSILPFDAEMRISAEAPPFNSSFNSPDDLYCVSAKEIQLWLSLYRLCSSSIAFDSELAAKICSVTGLCCESAVLLEDVLDDVDDEVEPVLL